MKNTNEILSIMENELVRLIDVFNKWQNHGDYRAVIELVILCKEMEIPFDWEQGVNAKGDVEIIESITISGKRIEFMKGEERNAYRKEEIYKCIRNLLHDSI